MFNIKYARNLKAAKKLKNSTTTDDKYRTPIKTVAYVPINFWEVAWETIAEELFLVSAWPGFLL